MNYLNNPLENLSDAISDATYARIKSVEYQNKDWIKSKEEGGDVYITRHRLPRKDEINVVSMFPQLWGSTALGFGGVGGAAMTYAYTIILEYQMKYMVYFDGKFAYDIDHPSDVFYNDLKNFNMRSLRMMGDYIREDKHAK